MPSIVSLIRNLSRDEFMGIVVISITVAVFAWYQTNMTGIERWMNTTMVLLVSGAVATATSLVLKKWDPFWYSS